MSKMVGSQARGRAGMHLRVEKEDTSSDRTDRLDRLWLNHLRSRQVNPGRNRDRSRNVEAVAAAQRAAGFRICTADDEGSCL